MRGLEIFNPVFCQTPPPRTVKGRPSALVPYDCAGNNKQLSIPVCAVVDISPMKHGDMLSFCPVKKKIEQFPRRDEQLTFGTRRTTLLSTQRRPTCPNSQLARPKLPRRSRANTPRLKPLSKKSCLSRTRLSRRISMPRSEHGNGAGNGLPATLPAQRTRKPFRPPCQSPPQRSTASPRSAIKLVRSAVHH